jgi:hypothetical protein
MCLDPDCKSRSFNAPLGSDRIAGQAGAGPSLVVPMGAQLAMWAEAAVWLSCATGICVDHASAKARDRRVGLVTGAERLARDPRRDRLVGGARSRSRTSHTLKRYRQRLVRMTTGSE